MQCVELQAGALVLRTDVPVASCTAPLVVVADASDVAVQSITTEALTQSFAWGFGAVFFFYSLGLAVGVVKRVISKA